VGCQELLAIWSYCPGHSVTRRRGCPFLVPPPQGIELGARLDPWRPTTPSSAVCCLCSAQAGTERHAGFKDYLVITLAQYPCATARFVFIERQPGNATHVESCSGFGPFREAH
jgi:hypothetical protein